MNEIIKYNIISKLNSINWDQLDIMDVDVAYNFLIEKLMKHLMNLPQKKQKILIVIKYLIMSG